MISLESGKCMVTFAIPTYNRAEYLRITLEQIIEEISNVSINAEVVVSDNGSSDNTSEILEEFRKRYAFFRYFKNSTNLGFDLNLIKAIKHSHGEYVWTFSDDDLIEKGALSEIIRLINIYKPNYICVNYDQFSVMNNEIKKIKIDKESRKFDELIQSVRFDLNFREIISLIIARPGYLPINIFKKESLDLDLILEHVDKVKAWSHIWMIAQATIAGSGVLSPFLAVSQRAGNSSASASVFFKQLPDTYSFIFTFYGIDQTFRNVFFKSLSNVLFSVWSIIYTVVGLKLTRLKFDSIEISEVVRKPSAVLILKVLDRVIPRFLVIFPTKFVRYLKGKGFTLDDNAQKPRF